MAKKIIFFLVLLLLAGLSAFFLFEPSPEPASPSASVGKKDAPEKKIAAESGVSESAPINKIETSAPRDLEKVPEEASFEVPFYSQAPMGQWDVIHEDMCEEASLLNAAYYLLGKKPSKEEYENELQKMKIAEEREIGEWKSTTVAQTKKLVETYFEGKVKVKVIDNPTIEQIEAQISEGNPVVVPLSGREIGNPNFTPPGPVYHMLIIKGYDRKNFMTNDVGTRKGNSYLYKKEVIMQNIHDWNPEDIHLGEKRLLILYK